MKFTIFSCLILFCFFISTSCGFGYYDDGYDYDYDYDYSYDSAMADITFTYTLTERVKIEITSIQQSHEKCSNSYSAYSAVAVYYNLTNLMNSELLKSTVYFIATADDNTVFTNFGTTCDIPAQSTTSGVVEIETMGKKVVNVEFYKFFDNNKDGQYFLNIDYKIENIGKITIDSCEIFLKIYYTDGRTERLTNSTTNDIKEGETITFTAQNIIDEKVTNVEYYNDWLYRKW